MEIKAFKMDGLGNDFIIIDQRKEKIILSKDQIIKIYKSKIKEFNKHNKLPLLQY